MACWLLDGLSNIFFTNVLATSNHICHSSHPPLPSANQITCSSQSPLEPEGQAKEKLEDNDNSEIKRRKPGRSDQPRRIHNRCTKRKPRSPKEEGTGKQPEQTQSPHKTLHHHPPLPSATRLNKTDSNKVLHQRYTYATKIVLRHNVLHCMARNKCLLITQNYASI